MFKKSVFLMATTLTLSGVLLGAGTQSPPSTPRAVTPDQHDSLGSKSADQGFVTETAMNGMAEVELGKLATEKGSDAKVKAFGQRMVADHGKAGEELKTLAASKHIMLPTTVDATHRAAHDKLASLSGTEFDRAYVTDMVAGHKKAVAAFTAESTTGKDSEIKAWAAKTLPTVREHLRMIEDLDKQHSSSRATQ